MTRDPQKHSELTAAAGGAQVRTQSDVSLATSSTLRPECIPRCCLQTCTQSPYAHAHTCSKRKTKTPAARAHSAPPAQLLYCEGKSPRFEKCVRVDGYRARTRKSGLSGDGPPLSPRASSVSPALDYCPQKLAPSCSSFRCARMESITDSTFVSTSRVEIPHPSDPQRSAHVPA